MENTIDKIIDILYYIPNMNRDCMGSIINPIDTEVHANRLLTFLEEHIDNKDVMRVSYLLKHKHEIIGN